MYAHNKQFQIGDKINGEYSIIDIFGGEGKTGMGVVYLVQSRETPGHVVLKTHQKRLDAKSKEQFIKEAKSWIDIGVHHNIVQAYWVREFQDQLFVCAEYIRPDEHGFNTLTQIIEQGFIRPEFILTWAAQFCYGMDHALSKGMIAHRDIKPANLMVDRNGVLKVSDFGLAKPKLQEKTKLFGLFSKDKTTNSDHEVMGTLPFMSPEHIENPKAVDHRSDIYSFGIVLYQMLTGNRYPFEINLNKGHLFEQFRNAHLNTAPSLPNIELMPLVEKCLAKNRKDRYQTYDGFLKDIKKHSASLNIKIPPQVILNAEHEELYAKAQSYTAIGEMPKAHEFICEYVNKYPENYCGWTEKGRIEYDLGLFDDAISSTNQSLDINPYNSHAWNNLGILYGKANAPVEKRIYALEQAIKYDPFNAGALANLIGPYLDSGNYRAATDTSNKVLSLNHEKHNVQHNVKSAIITLLEKRKTELSFELLSTWIKYFPDDLDSWHNLGLTALATNNIDKAIECFEKTYNANPNDNFALEYLAKLYFDKKKGIQCIEACNELIQRKHKLGLAVGLKARVMNFMGAYGPAINLLFPYVKHNPDNETFLLIKAEIHAYNEKYKQALQDYQRALKIVERNNPPDLAERKQFIMAHISELNKKVN